MRPTSSTRTWPGIWLALVEGGDFTVRDTRVFLKTLAGLEPVDVIVRRQDDAFCDPLEIAPAICPRGGRAAPGRAAGNVAIANALGSGWLETPALLALLPTIGHHLLGEDLKIPAVPTWWCGQPDAFALRLGPSGGRQGERRLRRSGSSRPCPVTPSAAPNADA